MASYMAGLVNIEHYGPTGQKLLYVGIAAPQIGEPVRLICVRWGNEVLRLINPVIVKAKDKRFMSIEGCLSVPGVYKIPRPTVVKVHGIRVPTGEPITFKARDLDSAMFCHEIDHLDGITIDKGVRR